MLAYKSVYEPEAMFRKEFYGTTVAKAYAAISQWHESSEVNNQNLTPYRGYYNRFKDRLVKAYFDTFLDESGRAHIFRIEEIEIS